jgi:hypothetical protein
MIFAELIAQGGLAVGNVICFDGGQCILIGDATPFSNPTVRSGTHTWDGFLNKEVVHIFSMFTPDIISFIEQLKFKWSLTVEGTNNATDLLRH